MAKKKNPDFRISMNLFLYGQGNLGKTTTLRMLYNKLSGKIMSSNSTREIFTYKRMNIVICTTGDTRRFIEGNIAFLKKHIKKGQENIIFISAVNQKMDSYDAMHNYQEEIMEGYVDSKFILWVEKLDPKIEEQPYVEGGSKKTSNIDSTRLKEIIDFYIKNKLI